ncbi:MAG TPA: SDR family oxidoreductase [Lacipirellulaceae bacterium]|jgi:short-subunit dehydrogenase
MSTSGGQVVIGATSEITRAVALELARSGGRFVIAGRDTDELAIVAEDLRVRTKAMITAIELDVTAYETHAAFVDACFAALGPIDGIVVGQGYLADQQAAASDWSLARQMIDVNYASAVSLINLFADRLAAEGHGYICGISSVAGDRGRQSNFFYGSTKAAFSTYLAGLRNRLFSKGVDVITVKPGFVDTSMTWGSLDPRSPLVASPERVAKDIARAIRWRKNTTYTPWFWSPIMLAVRLIPEPIFKRLSL